MQNDHIYVKKQNKTRAQGKALKDTYTFSFWLYVPTFSFFSFFTMNMNYF